MEARVVVLNADYSFLNVIDWRKALCLLEKSKYREGREVEVVKYSDKFVNGVKGMKVRIPLVMRLIKFIRTLYKTRVPFSKKNVLARDGYRCTYCGEKGGKLTIDHVVPRMRGGKSTFENCVAACFDCNNEKGHRTCREAGMFPKSRMNQPTISEFLMMKVKSLGLEEFLKDIFKPDLYPE